MKLKLNLQYCKYIIFLLNKSTSLINSFHYSFKYLLIQETCALLYFYLIMISLEVKESPKFHSTNLYLKFLD
jgi:hypothetical protein